MKVFNKDFPIKVKFKKSIFDDSFVEEGVIAYLTKVEIEDKYSYPESIVYELSFNQEPFIEHNEILLTECYFPKGFKFEWAGFIPCKSCNKLPEEQIIKRINYRRKASVPFPQEIDFETEEVKMEEMLFKGELK